MTLNGLRHNGEAAVLLTSENEAEAKLLEDIWLEMWGLGVVATEAAITAYRVKHAAAKKERKKIAALGVAPPEPDADAVIDEERTFDGDPATANVAWTECATPSAGGRDLEFPREMMPFFALGQSPVIKRFRTADGSIFQLTFTMRADNMMWRLMFSRDSIAAGIGRESFRPASGRTTRSDIAISFVRSTASADYDIRMVVIGGAEHRDLLQRSSAIGGLRSTRNPGGRRFGFY